MTTSSKTDKPDRLIYQGLTLKKEDIPRDLADLLARREDIPIPPPWRSFGLDSQTWTDKAKEVKQQLKESEEGAGKQAKLIEADARAIGFVPNKSMIRLVNAALCLRRPILLEGNPGTGKTSLAYAVAAELGLPGPYRWSIVSRTRYQEGLYAYDAIGRLQDANLRNHPSGDDTSQGTGQNSPPDVGNYLRLGPMGQAFYDSKPSCPAVLLIDEIDKSDVDMPNDLLHIFEDGFFEIPELARLKSKKAMVLPFRSQRDEEREKIEIQKGFVKCTEFPLVFMTSNQAREFPPAFQRRCLRLRLEQPEDVSSFYQILENRFKVDELHELEDESKALINKFLEEIRTDSKTRATDQLLNAVYLLLQGYELNQPDQKALLDELFRPL